MRDLGNMGQESLFISCAKAEAKAGKACVITSRFIHGFKNALKACLQTIRLYPVFTHKSCATVHSFYSVFSSVRVQFSPLYTGLTKTTTTYINSNIGV
jgi:hypothetical protein